MAGLAIRVMTIEYFMVAVQTMADAAKCHPWLMVHKALDCEVEGAQKVFADEVLRPFAQKVDIITASVGLDPWNIAVTLIASDVISIPPESMAKIRIMYQVSDAPGGNAFIN
jgi:hypothetical protein